MPQTHQFTILLSQRVLLFGLLALSFVARGATIREISSPDGKTKLSVNIDKTVSYAISYDGAPLLAPSQIDLFLSNEGKLSDRLNKPKVTTRSVNEVIVSPVPEKRKHIPDVYNEISFRFSAPFRLTFRVYNDGAAYRIETFFKDSIIVKNELAAFNFPDNPHLYFPEVVRRVNQDQFHTSFEEPYQIKTLDSVLAKNLCFTPVLLAAGNSPKIIITESDLESYPGMFLTGTGKSTLLGAFAPYPKAEKVLAGEYSQVYVSEREDFIAKTKGTRAFPWRVILIAPEDRMLPENDLVYRLASPSRVPDPSWITPRKSTEEWIITENLFNVPFKSGINTETYKYYIDFAKQFGFEQVLMDAGWSDNNDLFKITPSINMEEIVAYAKSKQIKLGMWTLAMTLDKQMEPALDQFNKWGVDFIMTDFIDRDDQKAVDFYHKTAQACANHKIMLMFHGAFKPAGFNRTHPHALTREAVLGSEYNIWSDKATPDHNLLLPFIRMTSGPMDYEPGLLSNGTKSSFRPIAENVMSFGTRTQQLAMFVVYESPIQLFSGNPSQGMMEPDFMSLLGSIPTTWDTTMVLDAKLGDYIVTARKKGNDWFIGAMNDLTPRALTISLDFLKQHKYDATICEDGVNADRYAADYKLISQEMTSTDKLQIKMAPGGGFLIRLKAK
ncbi:glycoside hydrolase family 97 protein [Dyadobacter sp. CY107]|uniref:glycoside hydrolase family 97 protein n=1 Tax=Dyadobacter fanqingshengii TaxID=2906443 RepID=UPI001F3C3F8A|nr:glycoside hydrolase family 97 protein [Dyadobacter fanqingshengii]MCF2505849.1 glycoside hydrolase family 97 protein [Dyadobacter fanqingshengii]